MIRKSAESFGFKVFLGVIFVSTILTATGRARAQQPQSQPAQPQQQTDNQQPSGQEAPEESTSRRKKPHDYNNWSFNVGGGGSLVYGTTNSYVRGGGGVADAGVARNYSKYFGFRLDFQWDNLPLRNSALQLAQAPGATSQVYSLMLDPIINLPVSRDWGGYFLVGPAFYHRSGKLDSSSAIPGSACNGFWTWWGVCSAGSIPLNGRFLKSSQNEIGENFGFGVTRKIRPNIEIYGEFRILHGSHNNITTDLRPITVGVRW